LTPAALANLRGRPREESDFGEIDIHLHGAALQLVERHGIGLRAVHDTVHGSRVAAESDGRLVCYSDALRVVVAEDQRTVLDVRPRDRVPPAGPRRSEGVGKGKRGKGGHKYPTSLRKIYAGVHAAGWQIDQGRHGVYAVSPKGARVRLPTEGGKGNVLNSTLKNVCTSLRRAGLDLRA
jgi:hypothetical protein